MVTAVITGASSGLGKEYINAIIAQYPSVDVFWLVARRKELLKEIAQEHPDKTIAAISLDLGKEESLQLFEQLLKENQPEIKVLVNNAGYGKACDFFSANRAAQTGMIDVNCRALTALTRLCLPYMLDDSLVVNVASIAAFAPTPRMSVYAATKSFVLAFSKALHEELRPPGHQGVRRVPRPHGHPVLGSGRRHRGKEPPDRQAPPGGPHRRGRRLPAGRQAGQGHLTPRGFSTSSITCWPRSSPTAS